MNKRWALKDNTNHDDVIKLAAQLNIDTVLSAMLVQRGITTFEDARYFFRPDHQHLHDPFLMKDMEKAVVRIQQAFSSGEKILVYGDYDVDGTTAVFVRHGKYFTTYSGLSSVSVSKGQQVKAGQVLGKAGSNSEGNGEIDFVLMQDTRNIDPEPWIKRR